MNMGKRRILRDFVKWQIDNNLLKNKLTIDYEVAETYLEELELKISEESEIRKIVELKLGHLKKQYHKFLEVGNKTAMHDYSCKISILESVLEDSDEANEDNKSSLQKVVGSALDTEFLQALNDLIDSEIGNEPIK